MIIAFTIFILIMTIIRSIQIAAFVIAFAATRSMAMISIFASVSYNHHHGDYVDYKCYCC